MGTSKTAVTILGHDLPATAARFGVTGEQLIQLEKAIGRPLSVRGDDLGYVSERRKFEVLMWANPS